LYMNKKAFTLVELLIAMSILGIILIIAIPSLLSFQKSNQSVKYDSYKDALISAAKLYTDSNSNDMFGNNKTGCVELKYSQIKNKNLIDNFNFEDTTCNTYSGTFRNAFYDDDGRIKEETKYNGEAFVRVYKVGNYYHYQYAIECFRSQVEVYKSSTIEGTCENIEDQTPPQVVFKTDGTNEKYYSNYKTTLKVYDQSTLSQTITIKYAWITTNTTIIDKPYIIDTKTNPLKIGTTLLNQTNTIDSRIQEKISSADWTTKTFKVKKYGTSATLNIQAPTKVTGAYYLVVQPVYAEDGVHNSWKGDIDYTSNYYFISKPFLLDNTSPTINESNYVAYKWDCGNEYCTSSSKYKQGEEYINNAASNESKSNNWSNRYVYTKLSGVTDSFGDIGYYTYKTEGVTENVSYCDSYSDGCSNISKSSLSRNIMAEGRSYITYKVCDKVEYSKEYKSTPNCTEIKKNIFTDYNSPTIPKVDIYSKTISDNLNNYNDIQKFGNLINTNEWAKYGVFYAYDSHDKYKGNGEIDTDDVSQINYYEYTLSGSSSGTAKGQIANVINENNSNNNPTIIKYRVCDRAGNCSNYVEEYKINIDRTAPKNMKVDLKIKDNESDLNDKSNINNLTDYISNTWSNKWVFTKASNATDYINGNVEGGVGGIYYQYTVTGTSSNVTNEKGNYRNINAEGESTIKYRVCDKIENCSNWETYNIKLDRTPPSIPTVELYKKKNANDVSSSSGLNKYENGTWYSGYVYTTASATDKFSGVDYYIYQTTGDIKNETSKSSYKNVNTEGISYIKYKACDKLGNCSSYSDKYIVKLDRTPPYTPYYDLSYKKDGVYINLYGTCTKSNKSCSGFSNSLQKAKNKCYVMKCSSYSKNSKSDINCAITKTQACGGNKYESSDNTENNTHVSGLKTIKSTRKNVGCYYLYDANGGGIKYDCVDATFSKLSNICKKNDPRPNKSYKYYSKDKSADYYTGYKFHMEVVIHKLVAVDNAGNKSATLYVSELADFHLSTSLKNFYTIKNYRWVLKSGVKRCTDNQIWFDD